MQTQRSKAERILTHIQDNVGGDLRISRNGVPHLVIGGVGGLSVAYFAKKKRVRVFTGYMQFDKPQKKFDFDKWPDAKSFIQKRLGLPPMYSVADGSGLYNSL
jgi:hypothetical protein